MMDLECDLGCFTDEPPWGGTDARPNHRLPAAPSEVDPVFILDTRKEIGHVVDYGDFDSILESDFDGDKHLYIIIHGYFDSGIWLSGQKREFESVRLALIRRRSMVATFFRRIVAAWRCKCYSCRLEKIKQTDWLYTSSFGYTAGWSRTSMLDGLNVSIDSIFTNKCDMYWTQSWCSGLHF